MSLQQKDCGGWSYNQHVVPDADTTLRVLQFLGKAGFNNEVIINRAEQFVIAHQQADGGIATYLPDMVTAMGYPEGGWTVSHPCVTALASRILRNEQAKQKARQYLDIRLANGDTRAYWWKTPWYVRYESGFINGESFSNDPVELSLVLLLKARYSLADRKLLVSLKNLQLDDGSWPASRQFRIPRPNQFLEDINEGTELVEDRTRIFSTAAAVVAISRQKALLN
ncbi:MAG: prenyltransferase/squalene oxidase repeat-containing protein [Patescibacteria group bacterium]